MSYLCVKNECEVGNTSYGVVRENLGRCTSWPVTTLPISVLAEVCAVASAFLFIMVALCNRADHYIFVLWFLSSIFFYSSPNLSGPRLDVYHTSTHGVGGLSVNLECRSEMCCTRLAENAEPKKSPKIRHPGTIAQLCRSISSQLRHVSTIGKKTC